MAKIRVAINGFGRIGRSAFKIAFERSDVEIVAINDLADAKVLAHLLKHDSSYGTYQHDVSAGHNKISVNGHDIRVVSEGEPANLPWRELAVDVVIEATGVFTRKHEAERHITAGAKRVVVSSPSENDEIQTVVIGANEDDLGSDVLVCSDACTTGSVGAVLAVLDAEFGVEKSLMTTIHSYTTAQRLLDAPGADLRMARSAAENIVPIENVHFEGVTKVLPQLKGKFDGLSVQVPTAIVSLSDITVLLGRDASVDEINSVFKKAANEPFYQGILGVSDEPLVSRDYIGNSFSGVVDLPLTRLTGGNLAKIMVWYDNEWGYSNRLVELAVDFGRVK